MRSADLSVGAPNNEGTLIVADGFKSTCIANRSQLAPAASHDDKLTQSEDAWDRIQGARQISVWVPQTMKNTMSLEGGKTQAQAGVAAVCVGTMEEVAETEQHVGGPVAA